MSYKIAESSFKSRIWNCWINQIGITNQYYNLELCLTKRVILVLLDKVKLKLCLQFWYIKEKTGFILSSTIKNRFWPTSRLSISILIQSYMIGLISVIYLPKIPLNVFNIIISTTTFYLSWLALWFQTQFSEIIRFYMPLNKSATFAYVIFI